ncbi:hypothetical protein TCAL_01004 [Tigriopus californicus]|uniref:L-Fucosyltransferase n=1 Tax=Tigriopus californicus TaxID=6832 RepID=A0A553P3U0_TIGCA|nr:hypothetical protein TCAL_01004 [Tigriopus californicus]|eukprot:TCALIF_01004-PA protein Name:"Similar to FUT1 Galactoside 2-alpha-L-fucosyltransferase 1 (Ateles belzebuth)" AED:0.12 eAED:0.15 QI:0/-1/0/1/-1/1/1/0/258
MEKFRDPKWNRNRFLHIYPNGADVKETVSSINHPRFYEEYRKDMQLRPRFLDYGQRILTQVEMEHMGKLKKVSKKSKTSKKEMMFVGIHCRRTDHINYELENDMIPLTLDYYIEAMSLFQAKFEKTHHVVFIFVSDDMEWGKRKISKLKAFKDIVYFVGNNNGTDPDAIGNDLGVLVSCNHTIQSHGTFSDMAGFLTGGLRIIPHHFLQFRSKKHMKKKFLDQNPPAVRPRRLQFRSKKHMKKKFLDQNPLDHPLEGI